MIYLDAKTAGLSPESHAIVRLSAILVHQGKELGRYVGYINPDSYPEQYRAIQSGALRMGGIDKKELFEYPTLEETMAGFMQFIQSHLESGVSLQPAGFNLPFTLPFLKVACRLTGIEGLIPEKGLSTIDLAMHMKTLDILQLDQRLSMDALCTLYGIERDRSGDFADLEANREIYYASVRLFSSVGADPQYTV